MNMFLVRGKYMIADEKIMSFAARYVAAFNLFLACPFVEDYKTVEAEPASFESYRLVHTNAYVDILEKVSREGKIFQMISPDAVEFEQVGVGGTLTAAHYALSKCCFAYHLGGGYHHGMPDKPHSIDYCNDVAIG